MGAYDSEMVVSLPSPGSWVLVQVTHVFNPSHVCICFPYGPTSYRTQLVNKDEDRHQEIEKFHEDLHLHYLRKVFSDSDLTLYGDGELVVARCTGNERWYRAKVIGHDSCYNFKVLYVDYGDSEWVTSDRIRQMEPQFIHLAFQAIHCYLAIGPVTPDASGSWSTDTRQTFESLVAGRILAALIHSTQSDNTLHADLYADDVNIAEEMKSRELAVESTCVLPLHHRQCNQRRRSDSSSSNSSSSSSYEPRYLPG
jgi:hypothetical protein